MSKSEIELLLKADSIGHFSYSFTKLLLEKLKELRNEGRLKEDITKCIIRHISTQLMHFQIGVLALGDLEKIDKLIFLSEEFLGIFEKRGKSKEPKQFLEAPIAELDLSTWTTNALKRGGVQTIGQLIQKTSKELLSRRFGGFGAKCLQEVVDVLRKKGLTLKDG